MDTCKYCHNEIEHMGNPMGEPHCGCATSCGACLYHCPVFKEMCDDEEEFAKGIYKTRGEAAEARRKER